MAIDEQFPEVFERESELAMSLEHPNVVPIYDGGDVDGRLYLAMRLPAWLRRECERVRVRESLLEPPRDLVMFGTPGEPEPSGVAERGSRGGRLGGIEDAGFIVFRTN